MASQAAYTVTLTGEKYADSLAPITLGIGYELSPFRFSDYLSADQAMRIAAMLTHAAMQVREAEAEAVVEDETTREQALRMLREGTYDEPAPTIHDIAPKLP